jgi:hypothetical protein
LKLIRRVHFYHTPSDHSLSWAGRSEQSGWSHGWNVFSYQEINPVTGDLYGASSSWAGRIYMSRSWPMNLSVSVIRIRGMNRHQEEQA